MVSKAEGYIRIPVWSDDGVIKALVDVNGRIPVQLEGIDVTLDVNLESSDITLNVAEQSPLSSIQAQGYGYTGSAWVRNNLLWGYKDRIITAITVADATAGVNYLNLGVVPAGEIWVIETISATNDTNAPSDVLFGAYNGSAWLWLKHVTTPSVSVYDVFTGVMRLKEGDNVGVALKGCTLNDNLYANFVGYIMNVS